MTDHPAAVGMPAPEADGFLDERERLEIWLADSGPGVS
jgi:hypothetical protein